MYVMLKLGASIGLNLSRELQQPIKLLYFTIATTLFKFDYGIGSRVKGIGMRYDLKTKQNSVTCFVL